MCGIAGIIAKTEKLSLIEAAAQEMLVALSHRGPDGSRAKTLSTKHKSVALAHTRLAINESSEASAQPIENKHITLCFNGEIYNYKTLSESTSQSDTLVLADLLALHGSEALPRLEGMFAIAWVDSAAEKLFLAIDPYAIKPLYYINDAEFFIFSSEEQALKSAYESLSGRALPLEKQVLQDIVMQQFSSRGKGLNSGVQKLKAGSLLEFDFSCDCLSIKPYQPDNKSDVTLTQSSAAEKIRESISLQLPEEPYGIMFSGGVDSALLASVAKQQGNAPKYLYYLNGGNTFEAAKAKEMADALGLELKQVEVEFSKAETQQLRDFMLRLPLSCTDPSVYLSYLIAEQAKNDGIRILLSGTGADELWAGYRRHQFWPDLFRYRGVMRFIKNLGLVPKGNVLSASSQVLHKLSTIPDSDTALLSWLQLLPGMSYTDLQDADYKPVFTNLNPQGSIEEVIAFDQNTYLPDNLLLMSDFASMQHGVELRVPFLGSAFVNNYSERAGLSYSKSLGHKAVLKQMLMEAGLPQHLVLAKKQGFGIDWGKAFRHKLFFTDYVEAQQPNSPLQQLIPGFDLRTFFAAYLSSKHSAHRTVFTLLHLHYLLRRS